MTMHTETILVLSTAHMPQDVLDTYHDAPLPWAPCWTREYGWMIYVGDERDGDEICTDAPKWLKDIIVHARLHHAVWVMFDADGPDADELPVFSSGGRPC